MNFIHLSQEAGMQFSHNTESLANNKVSQHYTSWIARKIPAVVWILIEKKNAPDIDNKITSGISLSLWLHDEVYGLSGSTNVL